MPHDLQALVDELAQLLSSAATFEDSNFNLVTFSSQTGDVDQVRQQAILRRASSEQVRGWFEQFGIATATDPVRTPPNPEAGIVARLCLPARWRGVNYGYFWFLDERRQINEALLPLAMTVAARAGVALAQQWRTRQDVQLSVQALLSPHVDLAEQAADDLEDLNVISRGTPVVAVVCDLGTDSRQQTINTWRLPREVLVTAAAGTLSAVVPLRDALELSPAVDVATQIRELAGERQGSHPTPVTIGIGAARPDVRQTRGSWLEASIAARVAGGGGSLVPITRWSELGVHRLLACGPRVALREAVLDPSVQRLLEHPRDDLGATAITYLECAGNVQKTAAELQVHRQTLYYRLRRIEEVTGLDLSLGRDRLVLHLGLTLAAALGAPRVKRRRL